MLHLAECESLEETEPSRSFEVVDVELNALFDPNTRACRVVGTMTVMNSVCDQKSAAGDGQEVAKSRWRQTCFLE